MLQMFVPTVFWALIAGAGIPQDSALSGTWVLQRASSELSVKVSNRRVGIDAPAQLGIRVEAGVLTVSTNPSGDSRTLVFRLDGALHAQTISRMPDVRNERYRAEQLGTSIVLTRMFDGAHGLTTQRTVLEIENSHLLHTTTITAEKQSEPIVYRLRYARAR
jgi:hypothetical protein